MIKADYNAHYIAWLVKEYLQWHFIREMDKLVPYLTPNQARKELGYEAL